MTPDSADVVAVVVDRNGQLGTISSSRRFKEEIEDMGDATNGLLRLRPVMFRYKGGHPGQSKPREYGLIAEEVAEVYPDLVVRASTGQIDTVQYHKLVPMLLNELQSQHRSIEAIKAENAELKNRLKTLEFAVERIPSTVGHDH